MISETTLTMDDAAISHFLVREPKIKTENSPLVIMLHGVGSNEKDLFSFKDQLPDNFLIISARAPFTLGPGSYAWFQVNLSTGKPVINHQQAEKSRIAIIEFIQQLKNNFSFNEKQVYLLGFSQGGVMAYSVALTRPDLIKGIAVMSGRLPEEIKPLMAPKENLGQLKIFISHGINDPVLNIQYSRNAVAFLKTLGLTSEYKEYTEGHSINNAMLFDLKKWLQRNFTGNFF